MIFRSILWLEPIALFIMLAAFWTPDINRVHTLWLMLPVLIARVLTTRRLLAPSPLNGVIIVLLALMLINIVLAPMTWGLWIVGRPLAGALLATSFAERVMRGGERGLTTLITATIVLALGVGVIALLYSQWTSKSIQLQGVIDLLPPPPGWEFMQNTFGTGFNVNEIAGALTWLCPLSAAIAIIDLRARRRRGWLALLTFGVIALALFLGQSRFAIFGVIGAMTILVWALYPPGRARVGAWVGLAVVLAAQLVILSGIFNPIAAQAALRDEDSFSARIFIWQAGIDITLDYPLTGIGLNQYRSRAVRALYPVPGYETAVLPHAHNEWIQMGADMGIPGVAVLCVLYIVTIWRLVKAFRSGNKLAAGIGAGLLAHAFFGLGDAITLYDRFTFIFWWLLGLVISLDVVMTMVGSSNRVNLAVQLTKLQMTTEAPTKAVPV